jgi:ketosteroid isomerase-like protein
LLPREFYGKHLAMKTHAIALLCVLAASVVVSAANNPADEKAVMATLEAMAKATIAKDVATLGKIYGEDVTYSHSSAQNQTKAEVLKAFEGPSQAEFMKFSGTTIRIYGDVALVKGVTDFRNGQPGNMLDNHLDILWVMIRRPAGPFGWQIVARQTTRIGPSVGTPVPAK